MHQTGDIGRDHVAFSEFFAKLRRKLDRTIDRITLLPLFGESCSFDSVTQAVDFIRTFDRRSTASEFRKYEVSVQFSNQDEMRGAFQDEDEAIRFLKYVTS